MAGYSKINGVGNLCCHTMMSYRGYQAHYCIGGTNRHCDPVWISQMWCSGEAVESPANTFKLPLGHAVYKVYEDGCPAVARPPFGACLLAC
jgi:hypothetical protein